jgi:hypothetical protein
MPATSVAARSRGKARRVSRAAPAARTVPAAVRRRAAPLSPRPGAARDSAVSRSAGSWNQASQQKQNAQLTMAWWRRIAVSERTWKSAQPSWSLTCLQLARSGARCRRSARSRPGRPTDGRWQPRAGRRGGAGWWLDTRWPFRQGARVCGGRHQAGEVVRPPPAQLRVGGEPTLGVPVAEGAGHRLPVAGIPGPVPGQGAGRVHRRVRVSAVGPGPAAGLEAITNGSPASASSPWNPSWSP